MSGYILEFKCLYKCTKEFEINLTDPVIDHKLVLAVKKNMKFDQI